MALEFLCPSSHPLTMPDDGAGLLVECPLCGARLRTPAASAAPARALAAVLIHDEPAPPPRRAADEHDTVGLDSHGLPVTSGEERLALRATRTGISFHRASVLALIFGTILSVFGAIFIGIMNFVPLAEEQIKRDAVRAQAGPVLAPAPNPRQPRRPFVRPPGPPLAPAEAPAAQLRQLDPDLQAKQQDLIHKTRKQCALLFSANSGLYALLGLIGSWYLLAVPKTARATGLIAFSLVMDLIHIGSSWVNESLLGGNDNILAFVSVASFVLSFVVFLLFLHRLAIFLGRPELARHASHHLRSWSRLISGTLLCAVGGLMLLQIQPVLGLVLLVGGVVLLPILALFWVLGYLRFLGEMRRAIDLRLQS